MPISYKNMLVSLFLVLMVALATWTTLSYQPKEIRSVKKNTSPDAIMEDVVALFMDKQGRPQLKLVTNKMTHYTENDTMHIESPQLTVYRESPQPWYISSKYAKALRGINELIFWENVIIQHPSDIAHPATVIKTPTLTVFPHQKTAETAERITMNQPNMTVTALGMHADMTTGKIDLLAEARGEYVPSS